MIAVVAKYCAWILRAFAYAAAANGDPLPALAEEAADALHHGR